jgi:hypothetical protein
MIEKHVSEKMLRKKNKDVNQMIGKMKRGDINITGTAGSVNTKSLIRNFSL